jgi:hypothetical protein
MPFTVSHVAAVLPFRRTRLPWSALVIGSFGPDFEYFLGMGYGSRAWHYYPSLYLYCVPFTLLAYFLFQILIRDPAIELLPASLQRRLVPCPDSVPRTRSDAGRLLVALFLGIATHIIWDSFTHSRSWPWQHIAALRADINVPPLGHSYGFQLAQGFSSIGGLLILAFFSWKWFRETAPTHPRDSNLSPATKFAVWAAMLVLACVGAQWRAWDLLGHPQVIGNASLLRLVLIISGIAWFLWELLAYGLFMTLWHKSKRAHR